ncbi:MAG TPA: c-type cytochrome [Gemmatimonadaceae bacterium]|nr:c-type cytochrome [Gemmatimonadaceae bacterium]
MKVAGSGILAVLGLAARLGAQAPLTPFEDAEARAIVRLQLPCLGCHELDGEGGRSAPSLTSVGRRRSAAYIAAIIADPQGRVPGAAMPRHEMPASVRDMVTRLLARGAAGADVPPVDAAAGGQFSAAGVPRGSPSATAIRADGAALYAKWCASCHGATGEGDGPNARYLPTPPARHADAATMARRPDDALYDVIAAGGLAWGRSARMPAFGSTLTDGEIRALVGQIRTLCRCVGPAWSRAGAPDDRARGTGR